VPRLAAPTVLIVCAASLLAAPAVAAAQPRLPRGADAPPDLPPGVVVAEHPKLSASVGQGGAGLVAAAARSEKRPDSGARVRPFWATVNICDTEDSPNALGVRTSVPGNGSNQRIFARYTAQWWSGAEQKWLTVGGSGVTDWVLVGNADMSARQAGWTFRFVEPPQGTTYVMRGVVELQWRKLVRRAARHARRGSRRAHRRSHAAVVRRRTLLTKTGMKHVQGGDPAGLSKAMCLIW
jgi:hypothetical protein